VTTTAAAVAAITATPVTACLLAGWMAARHEIRHRREDTRAILRRLHTLERENRTLRAALAAGTRPGIGINQQESR